MEKGICPNCGKKSRFRLIGADVYRCGKCGRTVEQKDIRPIVTYEAPQAELFSQ